MARHDCQNHTEIISTCVFFKALAKGFGFVRTTRCSLFYSRSQSVLSIRQSYFFRKNGTVLLSVVEQNGTPLLSRLSAIQNPFFWTLDIVLLNRIPILCRLAIQRSKRRLSIARGVFRNIYVDLKLCPIDRKQSEWLCKFKFLKSFNWACFILDHKMYLFLWLNLFFTFSVA